jgi:glycosyltransferase involved in cell wall biosynthesis
MATARRVTLIAHELRGFRPAGGMGTATTFLALALARLGHSVEVLLGKHRPETIEPHWDGVYRDAGIRIRPVPELEEAVEPWDFDHSHRVALGLASDPPDVVIAHDFGAPAYSALRQRQAGLGFADTLFVVFCHGTRRYVVDLSPNVALGDLRAVLGVGVLEQAAVELADAVVSPSAYLVDWMRGRGWQLPERTFVIPYFTESEATGVEAQTAARPDPDVIARLAFFGRVDEKKGLRTFVAALNALKPDVAVEFVGKTTGTWPRERVEAMLPELPSVTFESELDRHDALARLSGPGTLVVLPSLQENSPNVVYECLEHGIPFIASDVGGVAELVAPDDRARVLFEPTAAGLESALRRILDSGNVPAPVKPAVERGVSSARWNEVVGLRPLTPEPTDTAGDFELLLDDGAVPDPELEGTLRRLQRATDADVVTCGVRVGGTLHFFAGDAGGLAALGTTYGTVALVRRELLDGDERGATWPLLARLAAGGARIVSLPVALAEQPREPGSVDDDPAVALLAVQQLERALPQPLRGAARLAAGLAAAADVTTRSSRRRRRGWRP